MEGQLSSGLYSITTVEDLTVGRNSREDKSLHPKPIYALPSSETGPNTIWQIDQVQDDEYILKCHGAPTAAHDGHLYAVLIDVPPPTPWKITKQAQGGYTIVKADEDGFGWVVSFDEDREGKPIAVRPLIVQPSYPPRFPPTELFKFRRVEMD
ncbi:hypothetical protein TWF569_000343 [Orbilia oligospora]|uniref:Uncharacterized protein n=1 Tax=Orbilia oligospora TaxID=2813651 RepID=A0A7C8IZ58_ORBOL|nr:hypothetical protein TWF102_003202 [Orbilia oligospora]KAF3099318.1 hypothetical protein TWF103_008830 [Orbilia oligospora]KAF3116285.1 hypothetical protein TWF706_003935 [Orbilia oligospora]KAF3123225.1 hypothetical protein TWF703_000967 [Orbilia oligospora]KAF3133799.1 hypothetical protein TWF594_008958 [Orbilia oligospora]